MESIIISGWGSWCACWWTARGPPTPIASGSARSPSPASNNSASPEKYLVGVARNQGGPDELVRDAEAVDDPHQVGPQFGQQFFLQHFQGRYLLLRDEGSAGYRPAVGQHHVDPKQLAQLLEDDLDPLVFLHHDGFPETVVAVVGRVDHRHRLQLDPDMLVPQLLLWNRVRLAHRLRSDGGEEEAHSLGQQDPDVVQGPSRMLIDFALLAHQVVHRFEILQTLRNRLLLHHEVFIIFENVSRKL